VATRQQIVDAARSWIGTKWQHQQRLKGQACDCAGLVIGVGFEVFGIQADVPHYGHTPNRGAMEALCDRYMTRIDKKSIGPGDVILMTWDREPHHMGIVTSLGADLAVVHAHAQMHRVVEHRLDEHWLGRVTLAYQFPGVE
jgi:NlpC/P60 family putative phage cell wall peptidase